MSRTFVSAEKLVRSHSTPMRTPWKQENFKDLLGTFVLGREFNGESGILYIFTHLDLRAIYAWGEWFREGNEKGREEATPMDR